MKVIEFINKIECRLASLIMSDGASKHWLLPSLEHASYIDIQRTTAFIKSEQGYEQPAGERYTVQVNRVWL